MARKDDNYEEEQQEQNIEEEEEVEKEQEPLRDNPVDYIYKVISYLERAITEGGKTLFGGKRVVDEDTMLDMIDNLRNNMPDAIQYAEQIRDKRDAIIKNAERDAKNRQKIAEDRADTMIKQAEETADRMVREAEERAQKIIADARSRADIMTAEHTITAAAQNEANSILHNAKVEANKVALEAASYGEGMLLNVEEELQKAVKMVRYRREHFQDDREQ